MLIGPQYAKGVFLIRTSINEQDWLLSQFRQFHLTYLSFPDVALDQFPLLHQRSPFPKTFH